MVVANPKAWNPRPAAKFQPTAAIRVMSVCATSGPSATPQKPLGVSYSYRRTK